LARDERGSALVELAMTLPLLAMLLMAGTAVFLIVQARFGVQAAAREAAMIGSNPSTNIDPYDAAIAASTEGAERVMTDYGLAVDRATIDFDGTSATLERGTLFRVQIDYQVLLPVPSARALGITAGPLGGLFDVRAIAVLPIQQYKARWPCPSPDPICS
jgi:Flp pilus assembly protein TadG